MNEKSLFAQILAQEAEEAQHSQPDKKINSHKSKSANNQNVVNANASKYASPSSAPHQNSNTTKTLLCPSSFASNAQTQGFAGGAAAILRESRRTPVSVSPAKSRQLHAAIDSSIVSPLQQRGPAAATITSAASKILLPPLQNGRGVPPPDHSPAVVSSAPPTLVGGNDAVIGSNNAVPTSSTGLVSSTMPLPLPAQTATQGVSLNKSTFGLSSSAATEGRRRRNRGVDAVGEQESSSLQTTAAAATVGPRPMSDVSLILRQIATGKMGGSPDKLVGNGTDGVEKNSHHRRHNDDFAKDDNNTSAPAADSSSLSVSLSVSGRNMMMPIAMLPPSQLFVQWCAENANISEKSKRMLLKTRGGAEGQTVGGSASTSILGAEKMGDAQQTDTKQHKLVVHPTLETALSSRNAAIALHKEVESQLSILFAADEAEEKQLVDDEPEDGEEGEGDGATTLSSARRGEKKGLLDTNKTKTTATGDLQPALSPRAQAIRAARKLSNADRARRIRRVYDDAAYELIRQVSLHCAERARLLAYIWVSASDALSDLSDRFDKQAEKHSKVVRQLQLEIARGNNNYETLSKFVCDSATEEGAARMALMESHMALEQQMRRNETAHKNEIMVAQAAMNQLLAENKMLKEKLIRRRDFIRKDGGFVFLKSPDGTRIVRRRQREIKYKGLYYDDPDIVARRTLIRAIPILDFSKLNLPFPITPRGGRGATVVSSNNINNVNNQPQSTLSPTHSFVGATLPSSTEFVQNHSSDPLRSRGETHNNDALKVDNKNSPKHAPTVIKTAQKRAKICPDGLVEADGDSPTPSFDGGTAAAKGEGNNDTERESGGKSEVALLRRRRDTSSPQVVATQNKKEGDAHAPPAPAAVAIPSISIRQTTPAPAAAGAATAKAHPPPTPNTAAASPTAHTTMTSLGQVIATMTAVDSPKQSPPAVPALKGNLKTSAFTSTHPPHDHPPQDSTFKNHRDAHVVNGGGGSGGGGNEEILRPRGGVGGDHAVDIVSGDSSPPPPAHRRGGVRDTATAETTAADGQQQQPLQPTAAQLDEAADSMEAIRLLQQNLHTPRSSEWSGDLRSPLPSSDDDRDDGDESDHDDALIGDEDGDWPIGANPYYFRRRRRGHGKGNGGRADGRRRGVQPILAPRTFLDDQKKKAEEQILNFEELEAADEAEEIIQTQLGEIFNLRLQIVELSREIEKLRDRDQVSVYRHVGVNTNFVETRDIGITAAPGMGIGGRKKH